MKINFKTILVIFLVGLLGGVVGTFSVVEINKATGNKIIDQDSSINIQTVNYPSIEESNYTEAIKKAYNTVVEISCTVQTQSFFGVSQGTSLGSGVIISDDGYIVTNNHVVSGATDCTVTLYNGEKIPATLVGTDPNSDLAVIKIDKNDLEYATLADSSQLVLGEETIVIGNPLGQGITCTNGIISSTEKEVTISGYTINVIQTNAAINSGNSGGGLFNMNGNLIGIVNSKSSNSSALSSTATIEGMGYAIPSNTVAKVAKDLVDYGYVKDRAVLGVRVYSAQTYQGNGYQGLYISSVTEGGAADKAGIQANDILTKINDTQITSFSALSKELDKYEIGDTVKVEIYRTNERMEFEVTLQENTNN